MASATLTPYKSSAATQAFALVSTSPEGASWQVAGRSLSQPYTVSINRKIVPGAAANSHLVIRVGRTDNNATTGKPATASVTLDVSVPKDQSIITTAVLNELLCVIGSLLDDQYAVTSAVNAARTAILEGRDL